VLHGMCTVVQPWTSSSALAMRPWGLPTSRLCRLAVPSLISRRRQTCRSCAGQGAPTTQQKGEQPPPLKRGMFPEEFFFGTATSAYQASVEEGSRFPHGSSWYALLDRTPMHTFKIMLKIMPCCRSRERRLKAAGAPPSGMNSRTQRVRGSSECRRLAHLNL